ncbi:hypothetical protein HYC85_000616 [Camellia sinensis]|uniref:Uncharacterized protein n=1 Tax=Camellia sinensis TaxID=4442 RepID=A0A7J7I462_CAMSI|nr:hypothetical protein HYC85_000616 [Camellia sinensis]
MARLTQAQNIHIGGVNIHIDDVNIHIRGILIVVVTWSNKGIGLEICRQLALNEVMLILTTRDEKRGTEAVENLKTCGLSDVVFHQLDVTNFASIASLVNNAGVTGVIMDAEPFTSLNLKAGKASRLPDSKLSFGN